MPWSLALDFVLKVTSLNMMVLQLHAVVLITPLGPFQSLISWRSNPGHSQSQMWDHTTQTGYRPGSKIERLPPGSRSMHFLLAGFLTRRVKPHFVTIQVRSIPSENKVVHWRIKHRQSGFDDSMKALWWFQSSFVKYLKIWIIVCSSNCLFFQIFLNVVKMFRKLLTLS